MSESKSIQIMTTGNWTTAMMDLSPERFDELEAGLRRCIEDSWNDPTSSVTLQDPSGQYRVLYGRHITGYLVIPGE